MKRVANVITHRLDFSLVTPKAAILFKSYQIRMWGNAGTDRWSSPFSCLA